MVDYSACLRAARKFYPELHNARVIFQESHMRIIHVMNTLPKLDFLFRSRKKRMYVIYINVSHHEKFLAHLSKEECIGWFGHELGHIVDYTRMSALQILWFGICYECNSHFRKNVELTKNLQVISRGLGKQLLLAKEGLLHSKHLTSQYKELIRKNYVPRVAMIKYFMQLKKSEQSVVEVNFT